MLKNLFLILVLLPATCSSQPEIGIKLGYPGASLHASYNWKKKQVSLFTQAMADGYHEHIAAGILINFKEREKKSRLYGGLGAGYAIGRYFPPGSTTIGVSPSNPSPYKVPLSPENQTGILLRSQVGFNFKIGRHLFLNLETGLHLVIGASGTYPILPAMLGLSYLFRSLHASGKDKKAG